MSPSTNGALGSSPNTSEATSHGTPSTNLTAFTPKPASGTHGRPSAVENRGRLANIIVRGNNNYGDDVFLVTPTPTMPTKLSPTADAFFPGPIYSHGAVAGPASNPGVGHAFAPKSCNDKQVKQINLVGGTKMQPRVAGQDRSTYLRSLIFMGYGALARGAKRGIKRAFGFRQQLAPQLPAQPLINFHDGVFSMDENRFRTVTIEGVPREVPTVNIGRTFSPPMFPSVKVVSLSQFYTNGCFTLSFGDVRDSKKAFELVASAFQTARPAYVSPKNLAVGQDKDPRFVSDFEGQAIVSVRHYGRPIPVMPLVAELRRLLALCGDVKALHTLPPFEQTHKDCVAFRVEFFNTDAVDVARNVLPRSNIHGASISLEPYTPDVHPMLAHRSGLDMETLTPTRKELPQVLSITGRSTVPMDSEYNRIAAAIQYGAPRPFRRVNHNPSHNAVDLNRIMAGVDVRTTIMLRNIPNRVDSQHLKAYLDETSHGCYDFMYLRIDFANNCNVGYAFINFTDAQHIPNFIVRRSGQRWNCYNSDKVAEVSYATIQGKDCLVSKFRNSSVMLEHPNFRPKIYYPAGHPQAGQEEPFPEPDNTSKMRRSVENAEHVGLYPSRLLKQSQKEFHAFCPVQQKYNFPCSKCAAERRGYSLPPARAVFPLPRRVEYVKVGSASDPFSGKASRRPFPPFRS